MEANQSTGMGFNPFQIKYIGNSIKMGFNPFKIEGFNPFQTKGFNPFQQIKHKGL
jgi:hypothetical protein